MRTFVLLLAISAANLAAGVPYFTEPALCPTRPEIAFVSGGDIWVAPSKGGEAHLLVSHPADESRPLYSPDGNKLAFVSTRTGNGDIYVLMLATGELKRLTFDFSPGVTAEMVYSPGRISGKRYWPASLVVAVRTSPVSM